MRTVKDIFDSKPKVYNIISPDVLVIDALEELNTINLSYLIVMENDEYKGCRQGDADPAQNSHRGLVSGVLTPSCGRT